MLICAVPFVASAEEGSVDAVEENGTVTENLPTVEENVTESEISPDTEVVEPSMTDTIVEYVKTHLEELSVIGTLLLTIFYEVRKHSKLNGSIGTLNNNAVAVAKNSETAIEAALAKAEAIAGIVEGYKDQFASLLDEIRNSEEEKKAIKDALVKVEGYLNTAKIANMEFANELAELLCLANIPNSKKDELYAHHMDGVRKLEAAEEVMSNDEPKS
jgi:hypothetical protein